MIYFVFVEGLQGPGRGPFASQENAERCADELVTAYRRPVCVMGVPAAQKCRIDVNGRRERLSGDVESLEQEIGRLRAEHVRLRDIPELRLRRVD
jgi:hypothetical protein